MGASGPGHLDYLTDIAPPDVAVVLVVGRAHLGGFGGIEAVAAAKAEIVAGLAPDGLAVLNADDARVAAMAVRAPGEVLWFGEGAAAEVRAEDVVVDETGRARFTLRGPGGTASVKLQLVGEHHILNALAAAAAAIAAGLTVQDVAARLSAARVISPHRMAVTERPDGITVIDDSYNANPDSMRAALKALAVMAGRERRSVHLARTRRHGFRHAAAGRRAPHPQRARGGGGGHRGGPDSAGRRGPAVSGPRDQPAPDGGH